MATPLTSAADARDLFSVRVERTYEADIARVWRAFTDPEVMKEWWGPEGFETFKVESDLRPGGEHRIHMRAPNGHTSIVGGTYRDVVPHEVISFELVHHCDAVPEVFDASALGPTLVTITFEEVAPGKTRVVLVHEGFEEAVPAEAHEGGWSSSFAKLDRAIAEGRA